MNDLITLTCPKCGGQLHTESTRMKIYCQFCGTEILIKDFITERRIDKEDKILSYTALIENAKQNGDYEIVYRYYEEICKLEPSRVNIMFLNLYGYYAAILPFNFSIINDLYSLPLEVHKQVLNNIMQAANIKKITRTKIVKGSNLSKFASNVELRTINAEYRKITDVVKSEIKKLKTVFCQCGCGLEYYDECCPACGATRADIAYNNKFTTRIKKLYTDIKNK